MPLFDSLSTAQTYRLPQMNATPTTDDLRYAISEAQKRMGKTIELPFEHPNNHQLFIVKLVMSAGNRVPPSWTLQRGDGPSAIRIWNRSTEDVLMVQSKIKVDSQYVPEDGQQEQAPSQPMSLGVGIGGVGMDMDNPFTAGTSAQPIVLGGEPSPAQTGGHAPLQQPGFYAKSDEQAINAFSAPPQVTPPPSDSWVNDLVQPPAFNPKASRSNMPALFPGTPAAVPHVQRPAAPLSADQVPMPAIQAPMPSVQAPKPSDQAPMPSDQVPMPSVQAPMPADQGPMASDIVPVPGTHSAPPFVPAAAGAQTAPSDPSAVPAAPAPSVAPAFPVPKSAPPATPAVPLPPPIKLDMTLVETVNNTMIDPASGLNSFASFVYFLFRDFALYQKAASPLSVVVFEVALRLGNETVPLPGPALFSIIERIQSVISPIDIVTHLSGGEFAALLSATDSAGAMEFASAIHASVTAGALTAGNRNEAVLAAVGVATIPQTCVDPEVLIAAARQAKEMAKTLPHPILLFPS